MANLPQKDATGWIVPNHAGGPPWTGAQTRRVDIVTLWPASSQRASLMVAMVMAGALQAGCVDLSAVRAVATASQEASAPFRGIAADMVSSCERRVSYQAAVQPGRGQCTTLEKARPTLLQLQDVLDGYFDVLGQLASDTPVSFDKPLDRIAAALKGVTSAQPAQLEAADSIAKYLADLALRGAREHALRGLIDSQNGNVQKILEAQKAIAEIDYRQLLINEGHGLEDRYDAALQSRSREPLAAVLVEDQFRLKRDELAKRLAAVDTYKKALEKVASSHQLLFEHKDDLGAKALASELLTEAKSLDTLGRQAAKAF